MNTAGISPPISIDLGRNEPGTTLQFKDFERDQIVCSDCTVDGKAVMSPVDTKALPAGVCRLIW